MASTLSNPYVDVFEVLQAMRADTRVAPGALGMIHRAVDTLRYLQVEDADIAIAERVSVVIHKLRQAHLAEQPGDVEFYWNEICYLADEWSSRPITSH